MISFDIVTKRFNPTRLSKRF